jgi:hypothetical protein
MTRTTIVIAAALALAVMLPAVSAQAQAPRTFVSAAGSDSNPCSFAAPCRHFQAAVNATTVGGEVDALDPAGYGPIAISHAITIEGQGWSYIAPPASGAAITITAPASDTISIHGVSLNGAGIAGNTTGIVFADGGALEIADCVIRNFTQNGIYVGVASVARLLISNTRVLDNPTAGIDLEPAQGAAGNGQIFASIDHVTANNNGYGIFSNNTAGDIRAEIINSVISSNVTAGIAITDGFDSHGTAHAGLFVIKGSTISHNDFSSASTGISVSGASSSNVLLSHSSIFDNNTGIMISGSSNFVYSAGNNDIFINSTPISGGPLQSNSEQ